MKHVIIPIAGFARAGKDTLANAIFEQLAEDEPEYSAIVLKFAEQQAAAGLHVEKIGYYPTPGKPWILVVNKPSA
jgi:hypothetical protein